MDTPNIVVPPGQDPGSPGRSFSLKLRGGETGDSIMMFEECSRRQADEGPRPPPVRELAPASRRRKHAEASDFGDGEGPHRLREVAPPTRKPDKT